MREQRAQQTCRNDGPGITQQRRAQGEQQSHTGHQAGQEIDDMQTPPRSHANENQCHQFDEYECENGIDDPAVRE